MGSLINSPKQHTTNAAQINRSRYRDTIASLPQPERSRFAGKHTWAGPTVFTCGRAFGVEMVYVNGFNKQLNECENGAYMLRFDDSLDAVSHTLVLVIENESYIFSRFRNNICITNWYSRNAKIEMRFKKADTQFIKNLFSECDSIDVGD